MSIDIKGLPGGTIGGTEKSHRTDAIKQSLSSDSSKASSNPTGRADRVSLTDSATQLQALEEKISGLPVVDSQRVSEIKQALATGSHEINPGSVADKLMESERAFAQKK
ncbi:hypothetical protein MNBD_GAMMA26-1555 [hydrothermal vent metagenome]|uniref:Negative regulator of flagellin synthesis n=1 Tax=hydrothermal vent metagenome TaxID=652676 RepID=A0A3B1ANX7_9ZZZZ